MRLALDARHRGRRRRVVGPRGGDARGPRGVASVRRAQAGSPRRRPRRHPRGRRRRRLRRRPRPRRGALGRAPPRGPPRRARLRRRRPKRLPGFRVPPRPHPPRRPRVPVHHPFRARRHSPGRGPPHHRLRVPRARRRPMARGLLRARVRGVGLRESHRRTRGALSRRHLRLRQGRRALSHPAAHRRQGGTRHRPDAHHVPGALPRPRGTRRRSTRALARLERRSFQPRQGRRPRQSTRESRPTRCHAHAHVPPRRVRVARVRIHARAVSRKIGARFCARRGGGRPRRRHARRRASPRARHAPEIRDGTRSEGLGGEDARRRAGGVRDDGSVRRIRRLAVVPSVTAARDVRPGGRRRGGRGGVGTGGCDVGAMRVRHEVETRR